MIALVSFVTSNAVAEGVSHSSVFLTERSEGRQSRGTINNNCLDLGISTYKKVAMTYSPTNIYSTIGPSRMRGLSHNFVPEWIQNGTGD